MTGAEFTGFDFAAEADASNYIRELLAPFFVLKREIACKHLVAGNRLRIDFLGRPRPAIDFPFDWFGIEVKRSVVHGEYNRALRQAIDYTFCAVEDDRVARVNGCRIERVYLFPGLPDTVDGQIGDAYWVNRLAGQFHVGMIYVRQWRRGRAVYFTMSADRQWSSNHGPIQRPHNVRQRVGSGVLRVVK